jgi:membrane protease YdiL (CAAX protease family)
MLLAYEIGILLLGPEAMRNGADVWLRRFLDMLGFGQYLLLPFLTCAILMGWHHVTQCRWRFSAEVLTGMLLESALLGIVLVLIARLQGWLLTAASPGCDEATIAAANLGPTGTRIIGFLGAGIYEELLFRLMLLPALIGLLQWWGESRRASWIGAILVSSLVFSAAHFELVTPGGDPFTWFAFLFRATAGAFFSVLFLCRGFGITVGAHTLYDIFVGLLYV